MLGVRKKLITPKFDKYHKYWMLCSDLCHIRWTICPKNRNVVKGTFATLEETSGFIKSQLEGINSWVEIKNENFRKMTDEFIKGSISKDEIIRYFGKKQKIFYVHFRNIKGKIPRYDEELIDEGDADMIKALKIYKEIGFNGILVTDHTPLITMSKSPWHTGMAYATGYIRAAMKALDII